MDTDAPDPIISQKVCYYGTQEEVDPTVKKFRRNYVDTTVTNLRGSDAGNSMPAYYEHRWVTESATRWFLDPFGRKDKEK